MYMWGHVVHEALLAVMEHMMAMASHTVTKPLPRWSAATFEYMSLLHRGGCSFASSPLTLAATAC